MKIPAQDLDSLFDIVVPSFLPSGIYVDRKMIEAIADPDLENEGLVDRTSKLAYRTLICSGAYLVDSLLYAFEAAVTLLTIPASFFFAFGVAFIPVDSAIKKNFALRYAISPGLMTCLAAASKAAICFGLVFYIPLAVAFRSNKTPLEIFNYFAPELSEPESEPPLLEVKPEITHDPVIESSCLNVKGVSLKTQNELLNLIDWISKEDLRKQLKIDVSQSFFLAGLNRKTSADLIEKFTYELNKRLPNKKFQVRTINSSTEYKPFDPGTTPIVLIENLSNNPQDLAKIKDALRTFKNHGIIVICTNESRYATDLFADSSFFDKVIVEAPPKPIDLIDYLETQLEEIDIQFREDSIEIPQNILIGLSYSDIDDAILKAKLLILENPQEKISSAGLTSFLNEIFLRVNPNKVDFLGVTPFSELEGLPPHVQEAFGRLFNLILHPEQIEELNIQGIPSYLLYGPPGCGKTTIAKSVAAQLQKDFPDQEVSFHEIKLSDFSNSKIHGTAAELMLEMDYILGLIDNGVLPVVFFDEIDMSVPSRNDQSMVWLDTKELLEAFFHLISKLKESGAILLAATNRIEGIDPALIRPGRFDAKIEIPLPSQEQLLDILEKELSTIHPKRVEIDSFSSLLTLLPGLSISDLKEALERAKYSLIMEPEGKIKVELLSKYLKLDRKEERNGLKNITPFYELKGIPKSIQDSFKRLFALAKNPELTAELNIEGLPSYLLFGPPGCGKTTLAKSVAVQLGIEFPEKKVTFYEVNLNKFSSIYLHGTADALRTEKEKILTDIQQGAMPVVFFDEIDLSVPSRNEATIEWGDRKELFESFLNFIDEIKGAGAVLVAATNRIESIDSALIRPRRFDAKLELPTPSHEQLFDILEGLLSKIHPSRLDIDTLHLEIPHLKGFVVSDLKEAVERAKYALLEQPTAKITTPSIIRMLQEVALEKGQSNPRKKISG